MNPQEQLGYLTGLVEKLTSELNREHLESAEWRNKFDVRLTGMESELSIYKTVIKTLKFLLGLGVALATLKWAEVIELWSHWKI